MGDLKRETDLDDDWSSADAGTSKGSEPDERPSRRLVPERTNTPAMPWGISVLPPALMTAELAHTGAAPTPLASRTPERAREPEVEASREVSPERRERPLVPAPIDRTEKEPHKKKVGLVRVGRPVAAATEPYELGPQLASHLAWLDDEGRVDLDRHLARADHRKALAMIAHAKTNYPKNVSIGRCAQIVERAAIARLLTRVTPLEAIGRIEGHVEGKEARIVAALFRNDATLDDALRASTLPRLRTLELLDELLATGTLLLETAAPLTPRSRPSHMRPRVEATLPDADFGADEGARLTIPEPIDVAARAASLREDIAAARLSRAETPVPFGEAALKAARLRDEASKASDPRVEQDDEPADEPAERAAKGRTETPIATERVAAAIVAMQSATLGEVDDLGELRGDHVPLQPHTGAGDATISPLPVPGKRARPFRLPSPRSDEEDAAADVARELTNAPTKRPPPPASFELEDAPAFPKPSRLPTDLGHASGPASSRSPAPASARAAAPPSAARTSTRVAAATAERGTALRVAVALGVVAVAASLVAVFVSLRGPERAPEPPQAAVTAALERPLVAPTAKTASLSTATATAAPTSTGIPTIELFIDAKPQFARVYVDNVLLTGRPITEPFARDEREHEVRIEAVGYRTIRTRFTARGDTHLILSLEPIPAPSPVPPPEPTNTSPYP